MVNSKNIDTQTWSFNWGFRRSEMAVPGGMLSPDTLAMANGSGQDENWFVGVR